MPRAPNCCRPTWCGRPCCASSTASIRATRPDAPRARANNAKGGSCVTVLVTGSSGHLGEALVRVLKAQRREVMGCDLLPGTFTQLVGSITDRDFVRRCMRGVATVLHTATLHKPHLATHSRQDFVDVNISGTLTLLEEAAGAGVAAFVYTSSTGGGAEALAR